MFSFIRDWFTDRTFGASRSSSWSEVRNEHIRKNPYCEVCGRKGTLLKPNSVHHKKPFHLHPELELEKSNLITLCPEDHLTFGHLKNWSSWNESVVLDCETWSAKIEARPKVVNNFKNND
jgi:5-methylcytosine-specific restriction endonuclease McrA